MSVTFWCPDAPRIRIPCEYCEDAGAPCDVFCRGYEERSEAPEVNLANTHAAIQLGLLGLDAESLYGRIPPARLPSLLQRAMVIRATEATAEAAQPASLTVGPRGAKVFDAGLSQERLADAHVRLVKLFDYAARNNFAVHYD